MKQKSTYLKGLELSDSPKEATGEFVQIGGEEFYRIQNYDVMRPFFMSLVSHSDHWMFISTTGGLSAGRKNSESALFPYYTDDKIRDDFEVTGSKTILRVHQDDKELIWEPFSNRYEGGYHLQRNLYKNRTGNKIVFEEANQDLQLTFRYSWSFSEKYGFVKESTIVNTNDNDKLIELLDGIQNIVPHGVTSALQSNASNLVNAYKKSELDEGSGVGMFMLSAIIVDRAEPSEALKTTTVWSKGIASNNILLSSLQLNNFRTGQGVENETDVRAERGAYFIVSTLSLRSQDEKNWMIAAEVNQDHSDVIGLIDQLNDEERIIKDLISNQKTTTKNLQKLVGKADGLQCTEDSLSVGRHYSNVLFNIMRGGIFDEDYQIDKSDFVKYVKVINQPLFDQKKNFFDDLESVFQYNDLIDRAKGTKEPDLIRISYEYLPLTFSRRHGDPSRPWNQFTIATKNEEGKKLRQYEGNWRDIFQNWEALGISFPGFIQSMITKFVNASTIDGYNPYRITRDGIDWETIEPDDPWSYIGYWGDHQIIYLLKLLEIGIAHQANAIKKLLSDQQFVYANVPYRIKGYDDIAKNPQDTITYDEKAELEIQEKVVEIGSDGKLVFSGNELLKANLTEKLLVTFLAKMSNYVPEGGIWLNTQRPEWNDANNALVGNGISMVTLYYMRRFASFMIELFEGIEDELTVNRSVYSLFKGVSEVLEANLRLLDDTPIHNEDRKNIIEKLGRLGEGYRNVAYKGFISTTSQISATEIISFFKLALEHIDHTIRANKRSDGLYHAYNLLSFEGEKVRVDHLYEMLEGQVAVLSCGLLSTEESLEVLDALKSSDIYRDDQYSYMLYPNRTLPKFLEKNIVPSDFVKASELAQKLLKEEDRSIIYEDIRGDFHFNGSFNNAFSLKEALNKLKETEFKSLVEKEYDGYLEVFEQVFNHKAFTGRSGTFYGYEGLGSIYWHMVSKLLVAVQENIHRGWKEHQGTALMGQMIDHYYEIRAGIGTNKSPELYGSVPTDPYSHTPGGRGVQQPGMTGQVKEDILNRWAELGVIVKDAEIFFEPIFLSDKEYLTAPGSFEYFDLNGDKVQIRLSKNQLAFTYCQVPVIYEKGSENKITVSLKNDQTEHLVGRVLTKELSGQMFNRTGNIQRIKVTHKSN